MGAIIESLWANSLILALIAYVLGMLTVWLLYNVVGGAIEDAANEKHAEPEEVLTPETPDANSLLSGKRDAPVSVKIEALNAELRHVRGLLVNHDDEQKKFSEIVTSLDEAINRANGRLKLIVDTVKNHS